MKIDKPFGQNIFKAFKLCQSFYLIILLWEFGPQERIRGVHKYFFSGKFIVIFLNQKTRNGFIFQEYGVG